MKPIEEPQKIISINKYDDLIYDVGMHKGEDTDFYLKKGFRVIAFEADPELIKENKSKFSEHIERNQLVIIEGAIVDNTPVNIVKFYKNLDVSVWGTADLNWAKRNKKLGTNYKTIEVNAVNFTKCLEKYGIPHYIKIDVEGADILCLKKFLQFSLKPDYISIESNKKSMTGILTEISLLAKLGYNKFMAVQQDHISFKQKVPFPTREGIYTPHTFLFGSSGLFGKELPGKWKSKEEIIKEYQTILFLYRWFGDDSLWQKNVIAKTIIDKFSKLISKAIPGWYDTHAQHSSVDS